MPKFLTVIAILLLIATPLVPIYMCVQMGTQATALQADILEQRKLAMEYKQKFLECKEQLGPFYMDPATLPFTKK